MATNGPFGQIDLLLFCLTVSCGKMILLHLKSSILAGLCKLNCRWSLFQRKLGLHKITRFCEYANSVYQAGGDGAWGQVLYNNGLN